MKKVKCHRRISSIRVGDEIIKFEGFKIKDKTVVLSDRLAASLLDKDGFELVEDLGMDEVQELDVTRYNRTFKKPTFINKLKSLFTGGKKR